MTQHKSIDPKTALFAQTMLRRICDQIGVVGTSVQDCGHTEARIENGRHWYEVHSASDGSFLAVVAISGLDSREPSEAVLHAIGWRSSEKQQRLLLDAASRSCDEVVLPGIRGAQLAIRSVRPGEIDGRLLDRLFDYRCGPLSLWVSSTLSSRLDEVAQLQVRLQRAESTAANALRSARQSLASEEASWKQRARVLGRISRKIRTPVGNILGAIELLLDGERDPQRKALLGALSGSGEELSRIADDLEDLALIDAGTPSSQTSNIDVFEVVRQVASRLRPLAASLDLQLRPNVEGSLELRADPGRVRQALSQLVRRVVVSSQRKRVEIHVYHRTQLDDTVLVEFEIIDGGELRKGSIASSKKVDDAAPAQATEEAEDFGIEVSRRLAKSMGGELRVDHLPNSMLRLTMSLTLTPATHEPASQEVGELSQSGIQRLPRGILAAGRVPRVLLVEDDSINRMVVARMLKKLGCDVGQAVDGSDAIAQCQAHQWDLVFMDLEMPGLGGLAATQRIRRDPRAGGRAMPIIALTGAAESDEGTHCISAGMDGFLTKPVRLADLQRELDRWLVEKRPVGRDNAA